MTRIASDASKKRRRYPFVPERLKELLFRFSPRFESLQASQRRQDPYADLSPEHEVRGSRYRLGILREFTHYHKWYVAACRELGVSYRLLDLSSDDWMERVRNCGCDAFLVWPSANRRVWREMFDERLRIMEFDLGLLTFPAYRETWMYESKRRTREWLMAHNIPHPRTWIFFERTPAEEFTARADLPVVLKTTLGGGHSGVWIVRDRATLLRRVRRAFRSGTLARRQHWTETEAGFILLQQYLPEVLEWRMVRIGESFFGHPKGRIGDFHSGSGKVEWTRPEPRHLNLLKQVTDLGGFLSMDVDIFETRDGQLLVNELQTVFGAGVSVDQARVDGKAGRFVCDPTALGGWRFEAGDFARNACANARVEYVLKLLAERAS